uniref:Tectorin alpha n=1 Tax=Scophthalmus maximus TaxID=52904 RepID=A0A8D3C831_SCOMX
CDVSLKTGSSLFGLRCIRGLEPWSRPPDEEEARTFVQVISEKYNPDNFPYGQGVGVVILPSPPGSPSKDRLFLPSALVLNSRGISKAGDKSDIATFCAHVVELDLSDNQLNDWGEICTSKGAGPVCSCVTGMLQRDRKSCRTVNSSRSVPPVVPLLIAGAATSVLLAGIHTPLLT